MHTARPIKTISLGRILITPQALELIEREDIDAALGRHARGDWGDVNPDHVRQNNLAAREGGQLFSTYTDRREVRFYIITAPDRSVTTLFLPGEN